MLTSTVVRAQRKEKTRFYTRKGVKYRSTVHYRFDDKCDNGHNTFSVTLDTYRQLGNGRWEEDSFGCQHDEVRKLFPELAPFIKWHLTSTDGPMHYIANTVFLAGDRDYNGLRKGEVQQLRNGKTGELCWIMKGTGTRYHDGPTPPDETVTAIWEPWTRTGEGKARELDSARECAVWPEATDEDLTAPGLEDRLKERLPALMEAFRKDMEALGFKW